MPEPTDEEVVASLQAAQDETTKLMSSQAAAVQSGSALKASMEETAGAAGALAEGTKKATDASLAFVGGLGALGTMMGKMKDALDAAEDSVDEWGNTALQGAQTALVFSGALGDASEAFGVLADASGMATARIGDSWGRVSSRVRAALEETNKEFLDDVKEQLEALHEKEGEEESLSESEKARKKSLMATQSQLQENTEKLGEVDTFFKQIQAARDYQANLFQLTMTTGEYSRAAGMQGNTSLDLARHAKEVTAQIENVSKATGVTTAQAGKFRAALGPIPGALDSIGVQSYSTGKDMNFLEASMKIATGAGMDFDQAAGTLQATYMNLGLEGQDLLGQFASIGEVVRQAGVPLETAKGYFDELAGSLKFLSTDISGAMGLLGALSTKLSATLGPTAIKELASGMVGGLTKMDMSMRAFQSQLTGGPGGMLGAVQMREDLGREGGMARGLERMQEAFQRITGHGVLTRSEVAESGRQDLAGAFVRQQELMQQMGLAGGEDQASKMADALKDGTLTADMMTAFSEAEDPVKEAAHKGNEIMTLMESDLDHIGRTLDMMLISSTLGSEKGVSKFGDVIGDIVRDGMEKGGDVLDDAGEAIKKGAGAGAPEGGGAAAATGYVEHLKKVMESMGIREKEAPAEGGKEAGGATIEDAVKTQLDQLRALQEQVNTAAPGEARETALDRVKEFFSSKSEKEMEALRSYANDSEDRVVKVLLDLTYMDEGMKKRAQQEVTSAEKDALIKQQTASTP